VLQGRRRAYRMGKVFAKGDIAELYVDGDAVLKVPRSPGDSDLMETEADALRKLRTDGDPRFRPYAPRLCGSIRATDHRAGWGRRPSPL
jgi:hypothetical protein